MGKSTAMDKESLRPLGRTVDAAEIEKFAAMAEEWWDLEGKFKPLHKFNPVRVGYIRDKLCAHFGRDPMKIRPLEGLRILDIGCGGGLLCEPMARLGATIVGVDATERSVRIAETHADQMGLEVDYRFASAEQLVAQGEEFDAVLNMEVVEHVADVEAFISASAALVRPGGVMFLATLNRTMKAYAFAIVGAEYVLRWLPRGTHEWKKFLKPSELARVLRHSGMTVADLQGVVFNPIKDSWSLDPKDMAVNYLVYAEKA